MTSGQPTQPTLPAAAADADPLWALLAPERLSAVADIGANPVGGDPPYKPMLQRRLCRVFGFEPQDEALAALNARKSDLETYLPYVVGNGEQGRLRVCASSGMTSLLEPDPHMLSHFALFSEWGRVVAETRVATRRLDDVNEIDALDFLKIDVQGSELAVFRSGRRRLAEAVMIQTEVSFLPLYKQQPVFSEIDLELRGQGFIPHALTAIDRRMILPMAGPHVYSAIHQLLEADAVYVRDFTRPDAISTEQLKHLALMAHHCYGSYDLAGICIHHLLNRQAIVPEAPGRYLDLAAAHRAAAVAARDAAS
ncbi:FkbM family methyltransferase [Bradyrhizobium sp. Ai1a-2]|uniref:FkbM family methyltransferase n=1 Tax=Bradyrhizobium sp. Ai1a-2 TaxID=196490 RepID=UPI000A04CAEB|nr:FkbM family methyltransferase [Bradyrhizobium sp. Ai1a-2]